MHGSVRRVSGRRNGSANMGGRVSLPPFRCFGANFNVFPARQTRYWEKLGFVCPLKFLKIVSIQRSCAHWPDHPVDTVQTVVLLCAAPARHNCRTLLRTGAASPRAKMQAASSRIPSRARSHCLTAAFHPGSIGMLFSAKCSAPQPLHPDQAA